MTPAVLAIVVLLLLVALARFAYSCLALGFFGAARAHELIQAGTLTPEWRRDIKPAYYAAALLDVGYNLTRASWVYRELPREWTFSDRVRRHVYGPDRGWRYRLARGDQGRLNLVWPGHI